MRDNSHKHQISPPPQKGDGSKCESKYFLIDLFMYLEDAIYMKMFMLLNNDGPCRRKREDYVFVPC